MHSYLPNANPSMDVHHGFPSINNTTFNPYLQQPQQPYVNDPNSFDILLGKEKIIFNHSGNRRFRSIINSHLDKYIEAPTKSSKSKLIRQVHAEMQKSGYRFLRKNEASGVWLEIEKHEAREKVSHALRDRVRELQKPTKRRRKSSSIPCSIPPSPTSVAIPIFDLDHNQSQQKKVDHTIQPLNIPTLCNDDFALTESFPKNFFDIVALSSNEGPCKARRRFSLFSMDGDELMSNHRRPSLSSDDEPIPFRAQRRTSLLLGMDNMISSTTKALRRPSLFSFDDEVQANALRRLSMINMMEGFALSNSSSGDDSREEFHLLEMDHDFSTHLDKNHDDNEPFHNIDITDVDDATAERLINVVCSL